MEPAGSVEKTQSKFSEYIESLPNKEECKYTESLAGIVHLCNYPVFHCRYRKKETYSHHGTRKQVCGRPEIMKLKRILGAK